MMDLDLMASGSIPSLPSRSLAPVYLYMWKMEKIVILLISLINDVVYSLVCTSCLQAYLTTQLWNIP